MQATFFDHQKSIRIIFHEPAVVPGKKVPAIILAHGAGGNVDFWFDRLRPFLEKLGIALYAPHYFDRTSTVRADLTTITDGVHVPQWLGTLDAAIDWVAARPAVDPTRISLVGISLGSFLSLALAGQRSAAPASRNPVRCIVEISGGLISPHAEQATSRFPPTLILHGEADNVVPVSSARGLDQLLTRLAVPHQTRIFPGEGHWFSAGAQMQMLVTIAGFLSQYL